MKLMQTFAKAARAVALAELCANGAIGLVNDIPALYSTPVGAWMERNNMPGDVLDDIRNKNIRVVDANIMGTIAAFDMQYAMALYKEKSAAGSAPQKAWIAVAYFLKRPFGLAYELARQSMGYATALSETENAIIYGDTAYIKLSDSAIEELDRMIHLSPQEKEAMRLFILAHELKHTDQAIAKTEEEILAKEADSDDYGLKQAERHYPDTHIFETVKAYRAVGVMMPVRGDIRMDYQHATVPFLNAARKGMPPPDPKDILTAAKEAAQRMRALAPRLQDILASPDAESLISQEIEQFSPEAKEILLQWLDGVAYMARHERESKKTAQAAQPALP